MNKFYSLAEKFERKDNLKDRVIVSRLNTLVKNFEGYMDGFSYNIALARAMEFVNYFYRYKENVSKEVSDEVLKKLILIMSPFMPHICEEMWSKYSDGFVSLSDWPKAEEDKIDEGAEKEEETIGNSVADVRNLFGLIKFKPKKLYLYVVPGEKDLFDKNKMFFEKEFNVEVFIFASNDKKIIDPQGKAKKAKPGKPAIYLE